MRSIVMSGFDPLEPPKKDASDTNYQLKGATLSVFPLLKEFYELVVEPPFQQRTIAWMNTVAEKCREYEKKFKEFKPENLASNEVFQSAFAASARIAVQSHQKEKLEALRNALLNTVIMKDLNEIYKSLFLSFIETITPLHISILKFYQTPREGQISELGPYSKQVELFLRKSADLTEVDDYLFTQVCKDLELKTFLIKGKGAIGGRTTTNTMVRQKDLNIFDWIGITDNGKLFLTFIREPESHLKID